MSEEHYMAFVQNRTAVAVRRRLEQMIAKEQIDAQARHPGEEMSPC
jgi:hypothetical protein